MDKSEILVLCSSQPGFLRFLVPRLVGKCRLLECYSVSEAVQLIQLHDPQITLVDLRHADARKAGRAFAMAQNSPDMFLVFVANPDEIPACRIPVEIEERVIRVTAGAEDDFTTAVNVTEELLAKLESGAARRTHGGRLKTIVPPESRHPVVQTATDSQATPDMTTDSRGLADRYRTRSPALKHMLDRLDVAARHDVTILLIGETGSGKTHLARLIHESSARSEHPFVTVACGALPGDLIESELFGHVKGAFTSAHAEKEGKFLAAGSGTILLDEIDVLTPDQQVKLLRVIEQGLFEAVGSNETLEVKARIIAASNLELQPLVEQQRFRPDLYYRLNTLCFTIPPLRQRLPDIEPLAGYFVHLHAERLQVRIVDIHDDFLECLHQYPWPGNVREMENAIRSAVIYCTDGQLRKTALPPNIVSGATGPASDPSVAAFFGGRKGKSLGNRIEHTEKDIIEQALMNNNYSRTRTARQLGISRVTLYNKMKKYGMMTAR